MTFRVSIRPKYYLTLWAGFMTYRNELTEREKHLAKVFFKSLSALDKEDVSLLAEKYLKGEHKTQYVPEHDGYMGRLPITDSVLADRMGINIKEYREARIRAENRLRMELKQYADEK